MNRVNTAADAAPADTDPAAVGCDSLVTIGPEGRHDFALRVLRMARDLTAAKARIAKLEARVTGQHALIGKLRRDLAVASRDDAVLRMVARIDRETAVDDDEPGAHVCGTDCRSGDDEPKPVRPDAVSGGPRWYSRLRWSR